MSLWRQITRGLHVLTHQRAADSDVADEVAHFYEQAERELRDRGLTPAEARRAARIDLGDADLAREEIRGYGWENFLTSAWSDVCFGLRQLRHDLSFTLVAVLTLALGIGASTVIFSAIDPVLLRSLPFPEASRIMMIWERGDAGGRRYLTFGAFNGMRERSATFDAMAVMRTWQPSMTGHAPPERLEGQRVTADYFHVFGTTPIIGRTFQSSEDVYRGPNVVVLSYSL